MKILGVILMSFGLALLAFVLYSFVKDRGGIISPIPEDTGVKVIFVTPTP